MNSGFNIFIIILFVLITLVILLNINNNNNSLFGSKTGFTGQCDIDCTSVGDTFYNILLLGIDNTHHLIIAGYSTIGNTVSAWESYDNNATLNTLCYRKNGVFVGSDNNNKFSIGVSPNNMYIFDEIFAKGTTSSIAGMTVVYKGNTVTPLDVTEIDDNTLVCVTNDSIYNSYSPALYLHINDNIFWDSISVNDKNYISISKSYDNTHILCVDNNNLLYSVNYPIQQGQEIVALGNQKLLKVVLLNDKKRLLGIGVDYKLYSSDFSDDYTSISNWTLIDGNVKLLSITAIENL